MILDSKSYTLQKYFDEIFDFVNICDLYNVSLRDTNGEIML